MPSGEPIIACVGAVVFDARARLLVIRRGQAPAIGQWTLPGGRVESGETAEQAIVREVREETGLQVRVVREVGAVDFPAPAGGTYAIRDFLCALPQGSAEPVPQAGDDALEVAFMSLDQLRQVHTTTSLLEHLTAWGMLPGS